MTGTILPSPTNQWPALAAPPKWLQARHWTWLQRKDIRLIVVHTTECREIAGSAASVAYYFHGVMPPGREASSHLVVDSSSIWECVKPEHEAWAARGGDANHSGYHIEHCGFAAQTPLEWDDAFSRGELALSAKAAACIAARYGIPPVKLTPAQVARGDRGFCGHLDVTRAWNVQGGHVDPGVGFPWASWLEAVKAASVTISEPTP